MSYTDTLAIAEPISLVVTRTNERGERDLLGTHTLEWRSVLTEEKGKCSRTIELSGVGPEASISAGLLEMGMETFPKASPLQGVFLSAQKETERQQNAERERLFLVYSKQWWKEYLQIRTEHAHRMVKIFAQDEAGVSRCVCGFVRPLRAGRLLDGPRQAARFVSLVPFERCHSHVGARRGGGGDVWSSLHTLLSVKKGDVEDHCLLLCSLLLGYGLEAYVSVGEKARGLAHCWVTTIGSEGAVTFWESLTGQRYRHTNFDPNLQAGAPPPVPSHPYRSIGCLFNHTSFLANAQPSDSVLTCIFDLGNRSLWKPMSSEALQSVSWQQKSQLSCTLLPPLVDPVLAANTMELELRALMTQHRSVSIIKILCGSVAQ
jgi:centrosomal protein CEP76